MSDDLLHLALTDLGEYFARYRLRAPAAERALEISLRRYGQLSPVVVFRWHDRYELVDGFKRLAAARAVREIATLCARVVEADERLIDVNYFCRLATIILAGPRCGRGCDSPAAC